MSVGKLLVDEAKRQIEHDLQVGAVGEFLDGDTALGYLGDMLLILNRKRELGTDLRQFVQETNALIAEKLQEMCDKIVEDNVDNVAEMLWHAKGKK